MVREGDREWVGGGDGDCVRRLGEILRRVS
jgi:hypothetical protein